ncbi:hypothetical protein D3C79_640060 [compost metagenome]
MDNEMTSPQGIESVDHALCQLFKRHLKGAGISYKVLAGELNMSEVSVKRLLNQAQPLTLDRMLAMAALIDLPLSRILTEAEQLAASVAHFTSQQDDAFCQRPELYSLLQQILQQGTDPEALRQHFGLDAPSLYLYLRELEKLELVTLRAGLDFRLRVPKHVAFRDSARFPLHFKNQLIEGLQARVQHLAPHDRQAYLITARLRLTEAEFMDYRLALETLMLDTLKLSLRRDAATPDLADYTILDMGALGSYQPILPKPGNLNLP